MKGHIRKHTFKRMFKTVAKWFEFVWDRSHSAAVPWYPQQATPGYEVSQRITRLLFDYTRMDLEDGRADALRRLESWLTSEIQRLESKNIPERE
jgi:hypothetical protein